MYSTFVLSCKKKNEENNNQHENMSICSRTLGNLHVSCLEKYRASLRSHERYAKMNKDNDECIFTVTDRQIFTRRK